MEDLFSGICDQVENSGNRIFAFHNGVVDVVYSVPLTREEYKEKIDLGEQRFDGKKTVRIGGGGINFALAAASLGTPGIVFVGFMDREAFSLVEKIKTESGIDFPMLWTQGQPRRNTILELRDFNILYHDPQTASDADPELLIAKLNMLKASGNDWMASCSFYEKITFPLLDYGKKIFIDSGYGYPRREKALLSRLCSFLKAKSPSEIIVAANETELHNIADEFGAMESSLVKTAHSAATRISDISGSEVKILLHTSSFSTLSFPGRAESWVVPCLDVPVRRRTNAGDTFAGTFMAAYNATGSAELSCFFANAATAKRLATDELPSRENTKAFLAMAKLKKIEENARQLKIEDLRMLSLLASSAYRKASPARGFPALQTVK